MTLPHVPFIQRAVFYSESDTMTQDLRVLANALRALSIDMVDAANSGHPGLPLGMADVVTVLFSKFLKFDAKTPDWPDRDRFILSAGHGSALLYSLLHLCGYDDVQLEDLKKFRQLGSKTPGHPEYGHTQGVETTTGPLGQGLATAVGFAIAERALNAEFGADLVRHKTYVVVSDGDLMEGISQEAITLAGHLKLSNLVVLFDDNQITIDGATSLADSSDTLMRFKAAGWHIDACNGHNLADIERAIAVGARAKSPVLIACKTTIGYGSSKAGTSSIHGSPLGATENAATKEKLGVPLGAFEIAADVKADWAAIGTRWAGNRMAWEARVAAAPEDVQAEFKRRIVGDLFEGFGAAVQKAKKDAAAAAQCVATRKASEIALETLTLAAPELLGGSADLTGSNNTKTKAQTQFTKDDHSGRYMHYGIREHAMAAAMNGIALHGGFIPYGGTFMVFSDYCRPAIRLSALMGIRVNYVMTHDSIGVGEDGPTHQPVEHLACLRAIPNLNVFRPADVVETIEAWECGLNSTRTPSLYALTRQNLPAIRTEHVVENLVAKGAYTIGCAKKTTAVIFASGSEVSLALGVAEILASKKIMARVVSVPCMDLFYQQDAAYKAEIIGQEPLKIAIEAGLRLGWDAIIGSNGLFFGMEGYGASGPIDAVYAHFGLTKDAIAEKISKHMA